MSNTLSQEKESIIVSDNNLYNFSRSLIINSRKVVYQAANFAMVQTYWKIGEKIVEEQGGAERSKYGDRLIASLSKKLTVIGLRVSAGHMKPTLYGHYGDIKAMREDIGISVYV